MTLYCACEHAGLSRVSPARVAMVQSASEHCIEGESGACRKGAVRASCILFAECPCVPGGARIPPPARAVA